MSVLDCCESTYSQFGTQVCSTSRDDDTTFEKPFKSNSEDKNTDPVQSALKVLNRYCRDQGLTDEDVIYWDGEVREMMESVKKIREMSSLGVKVDAFQFSEEEVVNEKIPPSEEDIKARLAEIEKMDLILKEKQAEEKKAKLSTIQSEEESRDFLTKMPYFEWSTGIKANFADFMKLLSDLDNTESDYPSLPPVDGVEQKEQKDGSKAEEKENPDPPQQKPSSFKFIERNIKLAKCGRGTLSTTDEEKSRLEDILEEGGQPPKIAEEAKEPAAQGEDSDKVPEEEGFGFDGEIKSILSQIDQQLEVLRKQRCCTSDSTTSVLEENKSEEKISDEDDKQNPKRRKKREKTPDRLEQIDKELTLINSVSKEEVKPLSEKEMANLVQQSKRSLEEWKKTGAEEIRVLEESGWPDLKPPDEVIAELVSSAKMLMPKFKYRFGKS